MDKKFIIFKVLCKKQKTKTKQKQKQKNPKNKKKDHKILLTKAANLACKFRVTSP